MVQKLLSKRALCFICAFLVFVIPFSPTVSQSATETIKLPPNTTISASAQAIQLSAGLVHTCAVFADGKVACWGGNSNGQLGNGTFAPSNILSPVAGLPSAANMVAAGAYHSCSIVNDGGVWCWGSNLFGELGDGTNSTRPSPRAVAGLPTKAKSISAGKNTTCALLSDDNIYCWGANGRGQLGNNTVNDQTAPTKVAQIDKAQSVQVGIDHACAILINNTVMCWGANSGGQLGNGTTTDSPSAQLVTGLTGVTDLALGLFHTCALLNTSQVQCWGDNGSGQLGNGNTTASPTPVVVQNLGQTLKRIVSRQHHTCAIGSTTISCWGENTSGQLGNGTWSNQTVAALIKDINAPVLSVATGGFHTCVATSATTNNLLCVGENSYGQLGNGVVNLIHIPVPIATLTNEIRQVSAGAAHSCASNSNIVYCWGSNRFGELGDGTTEGTPIANKPITFDSEIRELKASAGFACVVTAKGMAQCWGSNLYGELGDETTTNALSPTFVKGLANVTTIATGNSHACAVTQNATTSSYSIQCWGNNAYQQLGNKTIAFSRVPIEVDKSTAKLISLSAGSDHTCVVTEDGIAKCWGRNHAGQLGDGTQKDRDTLQEVQGLGSNVTQIASGGEHTCALMRDGTVMCWGNNAYGQLGDGSTDMRTTPRLVAGLPSAASAISAGKHHTCAILSAGELRCWGANISGQLGIGHAQNTSTPSAVIGLAKNVVAVTAGSNHTCAIATAGRVLCWGENVSGQLGVGQASKENMIKGVLSARVPRLSLGYTNGAVGSVITLFGSNFVQNTKVNVSINGSEFAKSLSVSPSGDFVIFIDTKNANSGSYYISAMATPNASDQPNTLAMLTLDSTAPKRTIEGGGNVFELASNLARKLFLSYLPLLR
ncbi:MAG: RCC1 repeat-containing protein [Anaerolineae bacterium]|nr:RCC1 repeat-containing protein [Anaerolineae bacterium]